MVTMVACDDISLFLFNPANFCCKYQTATIENIYLRYKRMKTTTFLQILTYVLLVLFVATVGIFCARFYYKSQSILIILISFLVITEYIAVHVSFSTRKHKMSIWYSLCGDLTATIVVLLLAVLAGRALSVK